MYLVLFVMGSLLILASQVVRHREGLSVERQPGELAGLITDAQNIRTESQGLLEQLKAARQDPDLLAQLLDYEIQFESVDARISELVGQLPGEVKEERKQQEDMAQTERRAQEQVTELAASMKPKVVDAFALIRATIARAALQGLVRVESVSDPSLSDPVMATERQLRKRSRSLADSGLVISFNKDWQWDIYVEPGHVKSTRNHAEKGKVADVSYPVLRVREDGTILATVGFDPNTADLTINPSDATSRFAQALFALKHEYQHEELVANAILGLLQDAKARRSTL